MNQCCIGPWGIREPLPWNPRTCPNKEGAWGQTFCQMWLPFFSLFFFSSLSLSCRSSLSSSSIYGCTTILPKLTPLSVSFLLTLLGRVFLRIPEADGQTTKRIECWSASRKALRLRRSQEGLGVGCFRGWQGAVFLGCFQVKRDQPQLIVPSCQQRPKLGWWEQDCESSSLFKSGHAWRYVWSKIWLSQKLGGVQVSLPLIMTTAAESNKACLLVGGAWNWRWYRSLVPVKGIHP